MTSADDLLAEAEARSSGIWGRRSGIALDAVALDEDVYRHALETFIDRGDAERAARLVAALRDSWWARGQFAEGQDWMSRILALPTLPPASRARVLDHAGALAFAQGQYGRARPFFEASLELRRSGGPTQEQALALNHLAAAVRWGSADSTAAAPLYQESLALARQAGDRLLVAAALMPLGTLALDRGALAEARQLLRDGLQGCIEAGVETALPLALEQFAALAAASGQAERALRLSGAGAAWRRRLATYPTPYTAWVKRYLSAARRALPRVQAEAARQAGEAMSLEEAVASALEDEAGP